MKRNGKPVYKILNSWGKDWADNSFGYLPEEYLKKGYGYNEWTLVELSASHYPTMLKIISTLKNLVSLYSALINKIKLGFKSLTSK
jgi:hypothetical protein